MPRSGPPKYNPKKIKEDFEEELDFTKYQKEFQKLISICEKLDKSKDSEMIEAGKNYIIVRLFSLFDVEGRVIITDLIDRFGVKPSQALDETHLNVELDELEKLRVSKDVTIGKIVATNIPGHITHPKELSNIFSNINSVDFFPWIEKLSGKKFEQELFSLNNQRNNLVHNLKNIEDSICELKKKISFIQSFLNVSYIISTFNLISDDQERNAKILKTYNRALAPKKFDDVTKKFKKKGVYCSDCKTFIKNPTKAYKKNRPYYCKVCYPNHYPKRPGK